MFRWCRDVISWMWSFTNGVQDHNKEISTSVFKVLSERPVTFTSNCLIPGTWHISYRIFLILFDHYRYSMGFLKQSWGATIGFFKMSSTIYANLKKIITVTHVYLHLYIRTLILKLNRLYVWSREREIGINILIINYYFTQINNEILFTEI